jgi:hypothetical protein
VRRVGAGPTWRAIATIAAWQMRLLYQSALLAVYSARAHTDRQVPGTG